MGEKIKAMSELKFSLLNKTPMTIRANVLLELIEGNTAFENECLITVDRDLVEKDPSVKQIIPYIVLVDYDNRVISYKRKGSEDRLLGKNSIGFGGHWKESETFMECLTRELKEEINLDINLINELYLLDLIYTEESEVDKVHAGVLVLGILPPLHTSNLTASEEIAHASVEDIDDLDVLKLENWSLIAYSYLVNAIELNKKLNLGHFTDLLLSEDYND